MPDPTAEFFDRLDSRGPDRMLEPVTGTIRFDLATADQILYWWVRMDNGAFQVSRARDDADCLVHTTKARFDEMVTGNRNAMTTFLRGELVVHGDVRLLIVLERLLPGPPGVHGPQLAGRPRGARP